MKKIFSAFAVIILLGLLISTAAFAGDWADLDEDGDGVKNGVDECVAVPGPTASFGCPDKDSDGIPDKNDECPTDPMNLCPGSGETPPEFLDDLDRDGIANSDDACIVMFGPISTRGCPDADSDGISDLDDSCPYRAAPDTLNGCPGLKDSDEDGVIDLKDGCPSVAGPESNKGCPTTETTEIEKTNDTVLDTSEYDALRAQLADSGGLCSFVPSANPNFASLIIIALSLAPLAIRRKFK